MSLPQHRFSTPERVSVTSGLVGWLLLAVAVTGGCTSADPTEPVTAARGLLDDRGIPEVSWRADADADQHALEQSRELLAAPLTLDSTAAVVLLRNPGLQAELAELGVAQAELAQASRLANPGISWESVRGGGESVRTVGVAADIVDWLTQPLRRRMAAAELERTKLEVAAAIFDHVLEAQAALIHAEAARMLVARLEQIERLDRAAADYAAALFAAGNLTERERGEAEATWAESAAEVARARAESFSRREDLMLALGISPVEAFEIGVALEQPPAQVTNLPQLEQAALTLRLDLAAARWAVEAVETARRHTQRTRWLPIGVELGIERERESSGVRLTGPTVSLALPIFDQGQATLAGHDAELVRAQRQAAALEAAIRSQVRRAGNELDTAWELVHLHRDTILPERRRGVELALREYYQMIAGTFDLVVAHQQQLAAERGWIEALEAAWLAHLDLNRAVGRIANLPAGEAP